MKKWIAAIVFWVTCVVGYPLYNSSYGIIYNIFSKLYMESGQWDAHYGQMNLLVDVALGAGKWIGVVIYIWFIVDSVYQIKYGEAKVLLLQGCITQIMMFIAQIVIFIYSIVVTITGMMHPVAAFFTLPEVVISMFSFSFILGLAGALRGLAGVISSSKNYHITASKSISFGILQFVPILNFILCIVLKNSLRGD